MTDPTLTETIPNEELVIRVERPNQRRGIQKASLEGNAWEKMQEKTEIALNRAMGTIHSMAYRISQTMETMEDKVRPDEAEIEFGINLDTEAGAILAKTSIGAQLTVKLKWVIEQPERVKVLLDSSSRG